MIRPDARLVARIDLDRLAANWDALNTLSGQAECAAVIKANAYGHGVREIALTLVHAGCRMFFTAGYEEASELREILDPVLPDAIIAVFDGITGHDREAVLNRAIIPTINSLHDLGLFARWAGEAGTPLPAMLQLDTGMNRLGAGADELGRIVNSPDFGAADWRLVFSHLASADEPDNPQNPRQKTAFDAMRATLPGIAANTPASIAATGGIMLGEGFHYQVTRPGIGLYGLSPVPAFSDHLQPVISLHARVLQIRDANPGETVGYNATATLTRPSRLATIAGGYADGVRRHLSNKGHAFRNGLSAPIIGRVSMDTVVIDITDWPDNNLTPNNLSPGDYVELIHDGYDADAMAAQSGTIGYDILTGLGLRATPHYDGDIMNRIHF